MTKDQEYAKFIDGLRRKSLELQIDYGKLSDENKKRFVNDCQKMLQAYGVVLTAQGIDGIIRQAYRR